MIIKIFVKAFSAFYALIDPYIGYLKDSEVIFF